MTIHFAIRNANPSDVAALHNVAVSAFGEIGLPLISFRQYIDLFPDLVFLAETDETVIGYCAAGVSAHNDRSGWILSVAVMPKAQGNGVGKAMLLEAVKGLARHECRSILATIHADNTASIELFKGFNFQESRLEHDYYGDNKPRLVFEKTDA